MVALMSETNGRSLYLDNSAIIDISQALDGEWTPPARLEPPDRRLLAAARVAFFAHSERGWSLCSSGSVARGEGLRGLGLAWLDTQIRELEETLRTDALGVAFIDAGIDPADAQHCAIAASHPHVRYLVTNDKKILARAPSVPLDRDLNFIDIEQAEAVLCIAPGESPPIAPSSSNPLSGQSWWVR